MTDIKDIGKWRCQACGEGYLTDVIHDISVQHLGRAGKIVLRSKVCDTCRGLYGDDIDMSANAQAMREFREQIESEEPNGEP
jgi:hypothetical protein